MAKQEVRKALRVKVPSATPARYISGLAVTRPWGGFGFASAIWDYDGDTVDIGGTIIPAPTVEPREEPIAERYMNHL